MRKYSEWSITDKCIGGNSSTLKCITFTKEGRWKLKLIDFMNFKQDSLADIVKMNKEMGLPFVLSNAVLLGNKTEDPDSSSK